MYMTIMSAKSRHAACTHRSLQAKQIQPTKAKSAIAHIAFNPPHKKKALKDSTKMNEKLENRLNQRDIKPTAMRILVLQYLMEQNKATSLQTIENAFDIADKSTLYRTLKTFEKNKLVHTIDDGTKQLKYALCLESCECETIDQHYHFHCIKCQNTFCLTNQNIPKIELPKNFKMQQANMVIKGLCENCNK